MKLNQFYNIDCMEYMKTVPDKFFELAIVDPPYGIGMSGGKIGNSRVDYKNFHGDDNNIPNEIYFNELFRVSKNQIIWGGNYMIEFLYPTSCFIVWDKVQPEKFTMAMCEFAWTSFKKPAKIYKKRIICADVVRIHPTQKPVALYRWLLQNYAKKDDKIFDSHVGSGSSIIACIEEGFEYVGCEIDKDYYDNATERINIYKSQGKLF